jgi:uncharacterized protein YigE (DUF2233 family)
MIKHKNFKFGLATLILIIISGLVYYFYPPGLPNIVSKTFHPEEVTIALYWKDDKNELYNNIGALKSSVEGKNKKLVFAINGGMFDKSFQPIGLYIENEKTIKQLNTTQFKSGKKGNIPNFYLQPNGVFYITKDNEAGIWESLKLPKHLNIKHATQSGPMLVIDGKINKIFDRNSKNYNIRNGVGILPNKEIVFAISKNKVTFYAFAEYFKAKGCTEALFLDGYVQKLIFLNKRCFKLMVSWAY